MSWKNTYWFDDNSTHIGVFFLNNYSNNRQGIFTYILHYYNNPSKKLNEDSSKEDDRAFVKLLKGIKI